MKQMSILYDLYNELLDQIINDKDITKAQLIDQLKSYLIKYSLLNDDIKGIKRIEQFPYTLEQIQNITQYINKTIITHFYLYKACFNEDIQQELEIPKVKTDQYSLCLLSFPKINNDYKLHEAAEQEEQPQEEEEKSDYFKTRNS